MDTWGYRKQHPSCNNCFIGHNIPIGGIFEQWTFVDPFQFLIVERNTYWLLPTINFYYVAWVLGHSWSRGENSDLLTGGAWMSPWGTSSPPHWPRKKFWISSNCRSLWTTAYHPQCDVQVARFDRTLAMYVVKNKKDWGSLVGPGPVHVVNV